VAHTLFSRRFGLRSLWKIVVGCPYERSSLYWQVHLSREDVFFNAASVENGIKGIIGMMLRACLVFRAILMYK